MEQIEVVDLSRFTLSINKGNAVQKEKIEFATSCKAEGLTVGMTTMESSPPHQGECHNDGDEIIIVVSGKVSVTSDINAKEGIELTAGESCIIPKGVWHKVNVIEKAQLVYITPNSNNEYRF